jgi:lysophospholipid hydrolase
MLKNDQALEERGIPVDMVGGTSIGSFIGGVVANEQSYERVNSIVGAWALKASSYWFYLSGIFEQLD